MTDARRRRAFVDSSVLMRYFTGDDPVKGERCRVLMESAGTGGVELHLSHLLFAEVAWTLRSVYASPRQSIAEALSDLTGLRSARVREREFIDDVIDVYSRNNVDFIDAYFVTEMKRKGIRTIYSYDKDFDRLGVRRVEP